MTGCVQSGTKSLDDLSYNDIEARLIKGKTTKSEVTQIFGKPRAQQMINGQEMWIYNRSGMNPLLATMNKFITLSITFSGDVVADYQYNNSQISSF